MVNNKECLRCRTEKPESLFDVDYIYGGLYDICIACRYKDKKCKECKETLPLSSFDESERGWRKTFVICENCKDRIDKKNKKTVNVIFISLYAALITALNYSESNTMGIVPLFSAIFAAHLYFWQRKEFRKQDNKFIYAICFIHVLLGLVINAFSPECLVFEWSNETYWNTYKFNHTMPDWR